MFSAPANPDTGSQTRKVCQQRGEGCLNLCLYPTQEFALPDFLTCAFQPLIEARKKKAGDEGRLSEIRY